MTKHTGGWIAAVVLAVSLVITGTLFVQGRFSTTHDAVPAAYPPESPSASVEPTPSPKPSTRPSASRDPDPAPSATSAPPPTSATTASRPTSAPTSEGPAPPTQSPPEVVPSATPVPTPRPPAGSVHIAGRYLAKYDATRATWDDVIDGGRPLPEANARCTARWRGSGKDRRLDWGSATYLCLDRIAGRGYRPQGVAGSATAATYQIGDLSAADRNIIVTSWYSQARERGLFAPNRNGESTARLVVMDMDKRRYATVELVRPDGSRLRNLNTHASGLAWAGQYLYSSSRSALWMYNADDIMEIDGRLVLPATAYWTVDGAGALSSISIDHSTTPSRLTGIEYAKSGQAQVVSFDLAEDGLLANSSGSQGDTVLRSRFGERQRDVRSASSSTIPGSSYQGLATAGDYRIANSSSRDIEGRSGGKVDATVVLKGRQVVDEFRMPHGNLQSIYIDPLRGRFVSVTERGSQFMFDLPLRQLTG